MKKREISSNSSFLIANTIVIINNITKVITSHNKLLHRTIININTQKIIAKNIA